MPGLIWIQTVCQRSCLWIVLRSLYPSYPKRMCYMFTVSRASGLQVIKLFSCKGSIQQYFLPSLSYHLPLRSFLFILEWPLKTGFTEPMQRGLKVGYHKQTQFHLLFSNFVGSIYRQRILFLQTVWIQIRLTFCWA